MPDSVVPDESIDREFSKLFNVVNPQRIVMAGAAMIGILSAFLPWIPPPLHHVAALKLHGNPYPMSTSVPDMAYGRTATFLLFVPVIYVAFRGRRSTPVIGTARLVAVLCAVLVVVVASRNAVWAICSDGLKNLLEIGAGLHLTLFSAAAIIAAALFHTKAIRRFTIPLAASFFDDRFRGKKTSAEVCATDILYMATFVVFVLQCYYALQFYYGFPSSMAISWSQCFSFMCSAFIWAVINFIAIFAVLDGQRFAMLRRSGVGGSVVSLLSAVIMSWSMVIMRVIWVVYMHVILPIKLISFSIWMIVYTIGLNSHRGRFVGRIVTLRSRVHVGDYHEGDFVARVMIVCCVIVVPFLVLVALSLLGVLSLFITNKKGLPATDEKGLPANRGFYRNWTTFDVLWTELFDYPSESDEKGSATASRPRLRETRTAKSIYSETLPHWNIYAVLFGVVLARLGIVMLATFGF